MTAPGFSEDPTSITDIMLEEAASERATALEMLRHLGAISSEKTGVIRLLTMFAYIAASDWVDGDLCVDITISAVDAKQCNAAFLVGLGMGKMERVLPPVSLAIDLERLRAEVTREARYAEPLVPSSHSNRLSFALPDAISRSTSPPEYVTVAAQSLAFPYSSVTKSDGDKTSEIAFDAATAEIKVDVNWDSESPTATTPHPLDAVDEPFSNDDDPVSPKK